jgi:hypothetical protein
MGEEEKTGKVCTRIYYCYDQAVDSASVRAGEQIGRGPGRGLGDRIGGSRRPGRVTAGATVECPPVW